MSLVGAFVPIWLLVAGGYAARRWPVRGHRLLGVPSWTVFHVAMPAALFVTLARTPLTGFDARPLAAFAVSHPRRPGRA
jgi:malonate transporter and related proteins